MIIDTSAMIAILYREPEAEAYTQLIHDADECRISVANYVELSIVIENQLGPEGMRQAEAFFRRARIYVAPVTIQRPAIWRGRPFSISGKGGTRPA